MTRSGRETSRTGLAHFPHRGIRKASNAQVQYRAELKYKGRYAGWAASKWGRQIMRIPVIAAVLAATGFCGVAKATVVTYTLQSLGGSDYAAEFTVTNDTLGIPIEEFTIYFGVGDYENLVITSSPADWDPLAIQPDPGIPDDGFADWLALSGGIAPGASLGGFAVTFTFLGIGAPGNWLFDIVDPATFDVLDSGTATLAGGIGEIPLPGALWLFGSILAGAGLSGLRKRRAKTILAKSSLP